MNKRQKSAVETKRKLISAGLELIKEKGFDAINVEDITKKSGVAKGTFYIYFKHKEDIVMNCSANLDIISAALWSRLNFAEFKSAANG